MKKVAVVMGSKSDMPVAQKAIDMLEKFGVDYEVRVLSAHRTPDEARELAQRKDIAVFIGIAGMAAHLAGAIAANTTSPVIGVPVNSGQIGGMDALLSTVMMPPGMPVATVGIDAGKNAGILAAQILATSDEELMKRIAMFRLEEKEKVLAQDSEVK
ncbi:MAG: 5-(carboxyamino)imidazole ribonucleotide mutase [Clostridia bacterium]|nr:5-(carboxyamino)imidazole ribonucleotide mutase [Clostridia bacterium]